MDSKAFARKQATNIAKETVKQIITDALISFRNSEDQKMKKYYLIKNSFVQEFNFQKCCIIHI